MVVSLVLKDRVIHTVNCYSMQEYYDMHRIESGFCGYMSA
jgi:hypothetical protein